MKRIALILPILALLTACAAPPVPKEQYFRLTAELAAAKIERPLDGALEVAPFAGEGVLGERPLLFTANGGQKLEQRSYAYWTDPPPTMVRDELVAYLRSAGAAEKIVSSELRVDAKYLIQGKLHRLEQVIDGKNGGTVEIELSLIEKASDNLLLSSVYKFEEPADGDTIDAAVSAINKGMNDVFAKFVADLAARP